MIHVVYKIVNSINGKIYVGKHTTTNVNDPYLGSGKILLQAIEKYGREAFSKTILGEFEDEHAAFCAEIQFITELNACDPEVGYNITRGGNGSYASHLTPERRKQIGMIWRGRKHTESTREKMRVSSRKRSRATKETRDKIRSAMTGRRLSDDTRQKIRAGQKRPRSPKTIREKKFSEEHINNLKLAKQRQFASGFRQTISDETKSKLSELNRGSKNASAKLNESDVRCIKKMLSDKTHTGKEIADMFNVSVSTIGAIRSGRNWSHILIDGDDFLPEIQKHV